MGPLSHEAEVVRAEITAPNVFANDAWCVVSCRKKSEHPVGYGQLAAHFLVQQGANVGQVQADRVRKPIDTGHRLLGVDIDRSQAAEPNRSPETPIAHVIPLRGAK